MNNYWNTNFRASQPGYTQLRYVIASHGTFDPAESTRVANEAQAEIEWQPVANIPEKKNGRFATINGDGVLLLGASVRKREIILRLQNVRSEPIKTVVRLPGRAIVQARRVDATGRKLDNPAVRDGAMQLTMPPRTLCLVAIKTG